MKRFRSPLRKFIAVLAFVSLASLISTAGAFPPPPRPDPEDWLAGMLWRIHGELNLNSEQDSLWKLAEDDTRQMLKSHRERFETARSDIESTLSDANGNLHTLFDKLDADKSNSEARMKQNRKLWLSFYDSLDAAQKKTVNAQLLAELDKMGPVDGKCRYTPGKAEGAPLPLK
ncbi:hypothetical protein [Methylococcus geothermalis]|uniref:Uncharacterized protein n=1 Tax=Methylococcus geothermalis TaxID=2681310 RepID=A0A858Q623_9GAMM|nr:hypothetical protein [Methylococcus geothermalis]QJD29271.1 hypothetical protein GNH96_04345 [Methylococcus geothermalis]